MAELDRQHLRAMHYAPTEVVLAKIKAAIPCEEGYRDGLTERAASLVTLSRGRANESGTLDAFLREFGLSNSEGIALMCLAEALLRVPDHATLDALIAEKISEGDWGAHQNASDSKLVNASVWGLMLAGKLVTKIQVSTSLSPHWLSGLAHRLSEPTVRLATLQAMKILGGQFVLGRDIDGAIRRATAEDLLCSFDMLGEGARTAEDAEAYYQSYEAAIHRVGQIKNTKSSSTSHGISVKLSALHPRYSESQREHCVTDLKQKVFALALLARDYNMGLSLDAEECARLELSMDIFEWLCHQSELQSWQGLGFVLQAYQKRSLEAAIWLSKLAETRPAGIMVRLVKGAYWDSEIKLAQQKGLSDYPVFTDKSHTDLSYEACMYTLLKCPHIFCQFATHNARSVAQVMMATEGVNRPFELQKLHGMGDLLYAILRDQNPSVSVRTYAPVGQHEDLLPYLVRRLLENGANSSFVNRFLDSELPVEKLIADPLLTSTASVKSEIAKIPKPSAIFSGLHMGWQASTGTDLDDRRVINDLQFEHVVALGKTCYQRIDTPPKAKKTLQSLSPTTLECVGNFNESSQEDVMQALTTAHDAFDAWSRRSGTDRGNILRQLAALLETHALELAALIAHEAGRTLNDGVDEVREAVDFCRYYAIQAETLMDSEVALPSVTGEANKLRYHASGPWLCISPWNFPLAIFVGQIAANLAVGNTVVAKPAEQTPLVAQATLSLCHEAGVPKGVLGLVIGDGPRLGDLLVPDSRVKGVSFTGSHSTARKINQTLASRPGPIVPFIAETGGINCMIVDSTALPEQVVDDVITSAFRSAGQRCSALRVLYLQTDVAEKIITLLSGAMRALNVGDPRILSTDVGPVIDHEAKQRIEAHIKGLKQHAKKLAETPPPSESLKGFFVRPQVWEIESLAQLTEEVFGPVLHIIRYEPEDLSEVIAQIRASNFALTMGVHSRLHGLHLRIEEEALVGNLYINRDTVGAVVGSNPFGGHGLSGTGPKAGGPDYLRRLVREHTITDNITALGGNTDLFNLD